MRQLLQIEALIHTQNEEEGFLTPVRLLIRSQVLVEKCGTTSIP